MLNKNAMDALEDGMEFLRRYGKNQAVSAIGNLLRNQITPEFVIKTKNEGVEEYIKEMPGSSWAGPEETKNETQETPVGNDEPSNEGEKDVKENGDKDATTRGRNKGTRR